MNPDIHDQRNMPEMYSPERHLDKKLRRRLTIYFIIAIILVGIVIYDIIRDSVSTFYPLLALGLGIVLGIFMARMYKITWDHGARKAISRFDAYGFIILAFYIAFELKRDEIVEHFIQGPAVIATSFALFAGVMIGRLVGMRGKIKEVVKENL